MMDRFESIKQKYSGKIEADEFDVDDIRYLINELDNQYMLEQGEAKFMEQHGIRYDQTFIDGWVGLINERDDLKEALLAHRADLHNYSERPCPTCRQSAKALGIIDKVPDCCAKEQSDKEALKEKS